MSALPAKRKRHSAELTPPLGRTIVGAIQNGNFPGTAARLAGVSLGTLQVWLARGEKGEQPYADFAEAYRQAEAECESAVVRTLKGAVDDDWRAGVQFLGRRFPERWSDHAGRLAVFGSDEPGAGLQQAFQISLHLSHEEGGLPATGRPPAIDITPKEQPPRDRSNRSGAEDVTAPSLPVTRPLTKAQEWNAEVRSRPAGYIIIPPRKKPNRDGSPGDSFLN